MLRHDVTCDGIVGSYKWYTTESAFCSSSSALCHCVSYLVLFVTSIHIIMASRQFKRCVHPCPRFLPGGDTHQLCVYCLGAQPTWLCLIEAGQARAPRGSGPASTEAAQWLRLWGSQMCLSGGLETAVAHSQSSSDSSNVLTPCAETHAAASSTWEENPMFELSDSEELDVLSIKAGEIAKSLALHSHLWLNVSE